MGSQPSVLTAEEKQKPFLVSQYALATKKGAKAHDVEILELMRTKPVFDHADWMLFRKYHGEIYSVVMKRDGSKIWHWSVPGISQSVLTQMIECDVSKDIVTFERALFLLRNDDKFVQQKWVECNGDIYRYFGLKPPAAATAYPLL